MKMNEMKQGITLKGNGGKYSAILSESELFVEFTKFGLVEDSVSDIGWKMGAQKGYFKCFR